MCESKDYEVAVTCHMDLSRHIRGKITRTPLPWTLTHQQQKRLKAPAAPKLPSPLGVAQLPEHDMEDDGTYRGLEFNGSDLTSREVDAAEYEGCRFVVTSFAGSQLRRAGFVNVELERCDLSNMTARASGMHRVRTSASRLTGMTWTECAFRDVLFDACRADLIGFRFSTFKNTVFRDCTMPEANFQNADLRGVRFERCDLSLNPRRDSC
ncbi:pentapeptide repeat-containing protein [Nonomuraea sp. NPDC049784]|uniref:pentapeptide repeat-containing protein n=1 Tax=Nonomuraea sp. NPDC049784 TaxID=3154361 RepID=UPI00341057D3